MADLNRINELVGNREFKEAETLIEEALKEDSDNTEILKLAGLTAVNLNKWAVAKKHFETVVKFNQEDATSWFYLASCYEHLGDFLPAKSAYIKVIELRDEYLEAYKNLSLLLIVFS